MKGQVAREYLMTRYDITCYVTAEQPELLAQWHDVRTRKTWDCRLLARIISRWPFGQQQSHKHFSVTFRQIKAKIVTPDCNAWSCTSGCLSELAAALCLSILHASSHSVYEWGCPTELKIQEESPFARHWPNLICGESSHGAVME